MRENVRSKKAHAVYKETCKYFGFLTRLEKLSLSEIREQSVRLQTKYNADPADDFPDELAQFVNFSRVALTDPTTPRNLSTFNNTGEASPKCLPKCGHRAEDLPYIARW